MARKLCAVQDVLNIMDTSRLWYSLYPAGFNGYEISNDGYLRSMKLRKKYPYGILITPLKDRNKNVIHPEDPIFELTDNNNIRKRAHFSDLYNAAMHPVKQMSGYPKYTYIGDGNPRNFNFNINTPDANGNMRFIPTFTNTEPLITFDNQ